MSKFYNMAPLRHGAHCPCFNCTTAQREKRKKEKWAVNQVVKEKAAKIDWSSLMQPRRASSSSLQGAYSFYIQMMRGMDTEETPKPPLEVVASTEVVMAWRAWGAEDLGRVAVLRSITRRTLWPLGEPLTAEKDFGGYEAGGIYSFASEAGAVHYGEEAMNALTRSPYDSYSWNSMSYGLTYLTQYDVKKKKEPVKVKGVVYGRVALWGKVIEHELGFRGQFAYPQSIIVPTTFGDDPAGMARKLGNAYGVEAVVQ